MPTPLIVIGAILLFLIALLIIPLRISILLRGHVTLRLSVLFFSFRLFPRKKKRIKPRRFTPAAIEKRRSKASRKAAKKAARAEKKAAKKASSATAAKASKQKQTLLDNVTLVRGLIAVLFRKTGKHLHLRMARFRVRVATGDAATTAVLYGAVSGSLALLLAGLDRITKLHTAKKDVQVVADYLGEKSSADAKFSFSLSLYGAICTLIPLALSFLKTRRTQKARRRQKAVTRV